LFRVNSGIPNRKFSMKILKVNRRNNILFKIEASTLQDKFDKYQVKVIKFQFKKCFSRTELTISKDKASLPIKNISPATIHISLKKQ